VNDAEKRIQTVINNYRKGAYSLDQLKDLLDEGLQHIDAIGVKNVEISFIKSLAHLEEAIKRIENAKMRNTAEMQRAPLTTAPTHQPSPKR